MIYHYLFQLLIILIVIVINNGLQVQLGSVSKVLRNLLIIPIINYNIVSFNPEISYASPSSSSSSSTTTTTITTSNQQQQQQYGLKKGRLLVCKSKSNCISSSSITSLDGKYGIPWKFTKEPKDEYNELLNIIKSNKLLKLIDNNNDLLYIHVEAKSSIPIGGIDDIEFLINPLDKIITYRSNSRELVFAGTDPIPDGGSNKNRLEEIKRSLNVQEMSLTFDEYDEDMKYIKDFDNMNIISKMQILSQPSSINFEDNSVPDEVIIDIKKNE